MIDLPSTSNPPHSPRCGRARGSWTSRIEVKVIGLSFVPAAMIFAPCSITSEGVRTCALPSPWLVLTYIVVPGSIVSVAPALTKVVQFRMCRSPGAPPELRPHVASLVIDPQNVCADDRSARNKTAQRKRRHMPHAPVNDGSEISCQIYAVA